ncbi:hypothetical protein, partial [Bordetella bronchiseptica]|uniref:hypothetical protein n=1 Tax=Bordetella bronchiseptica TaxID=518 RepID=UPI0005293102
ARFLFQRIGVGAGARMGIGEAPDEGRVAYHQVVEYGQAAVYAAQARGDVLHLARIDDLGYSEAQIEAMRQRGTIKIS